MHSPFTDLLLPECKAEPQVALPFVSPELRSPFVNEFPGETGFMGEANFPGETNYYGETNFSGETNYFGESGYNSYAPEPEISESFEAEINIEKAKSNNNYFREKLRWSYFSLEILRVLGYTTTDPAEDDFARAVANWQNKNGIGDGDGIIGPGTWSLMLKEIIRRGNFSHLNLSSAILANRKLRTMLGWEKYEYIIYNILGFYNETPNEELLAKAIALWQAKLGFSGKDVDGRLGEGTWKKIRPFVIAQSTDAGKTNEKALQYSALVRAPEGIKLHSAPAVTAKLTNSRLYVQGYQVNAIAVSTVASEADWVKIDARDGKTGWIEERYLIRLIPNAIMNALVKPPPYIVQPGDELENLVVKVYDKYDISLGNDYRTIVHAFSILNDGNKTGIYYQGESDTWWRDKVLDRDMAQTRKIYQSIKLRARGLIYFPNESYIKMLRDLKIVGVRPDWKNKVIEIGETIAGFLVGVGEGFVSAGIDTVTGLWDLIKGIVTGELLKDAYELVKELSKMSLEEAVVKAWELIKEIVGEEFDKIKKDLSSKDPYKRFQSIGRLVGYLLFEIVLLYVTAGGSLVAKISKIEKVAALLEESTVLGRIAKRSEGAIRKAASAWDRINQLNDIVSLGKVFTSTVNSIEDINIEGRDIPLDDSQNELEYEAVESYSFEQEDLGIADKTGDEAENAIVKLLEGGDQELIEQGLPKMKHVIFGQYNSSGNGMDLFGFAIENKRVKIFKIEVKGGIRPEIGVTRRGIQMGEKWSEHAIRKAMENPQVRAGLVAAFGSVYPGKVFTDAEIIARLIGARKVIIISRMSLARNIEKLIAAFKRLRKKSISVVMREYENNYSTQAAIIQPALFYEKISGQVTGPILSPDKNSKATRLNVVQVKKSGLALSDIISKISRFADVSATSQAVDASFTESLYQFQLANYLNPAEQDGIIGRSTLETLGFVNHGLKEKSETSGIYGQGQLNRGDIKSQVPILTANEFSSANWFQFILKPAWLGVKINSGIHVLLLRKIKEAEAWLLAQPKYSGMTPVALGRALGFTKDTAYSAARLSADNQAMHGFGLAIDINVTGNPWIGAGWVTKGDVLLQERYRMISALRKASGDSSLPGDTVFAYLDSIAQSVGKDSAAAYKILKQHSDHFVAYLKANPPELNYWRNSQTFADRNPLNGFLNLHPDLVYALRQIAGLAWGAIDFGPRASGDIMHFDLRTIGIGKLICEKIGGFIPKRGHPTVEKEMTDEQEDYTSFDHEEFSDEMEHHEATGEAWETDMNESEEQEDESMQYMNDLEEEETSDRLFEAFVPKDWSNAVRQNSYYAGSLGWNQYQEQINNLLLPLSGLQKLSLAEEDFARAVAVWQEQQGFSTSECDGIIGPHTWNRMKSVLSGIYVPSPAVTTGPDAPSTQDVFQFNQWHAQKILDNMNAGIVGQRFDSKTQFEKIVRGETVIEVNPTVKLIQMLPLIYHITEQAKAENYDQILIGSFIRQRDGASCSGHCSGICCDFNIRTGDFESEESVQMVIKILRYLTTLPTPYKKRIGFGMPYQGSFFGHHSSLPKFKGNHPEALGNAELQQLVPQLGIVFPDNNNHLHIQVGWA
jgi:hypothetical protein